MALVTIPGQGLLLPAPPWGWGLAALTASSVTIDATGEKIAMCGYLFSKDRATKTIDKAHIRFGTVTKAGGSILRASLQSLSAVSIMQPDETQDQYRDIPNADMATSTWYSTGLLTSDGTDTGSKRSVAYGEPFSFVIEFDAGGRLGADSIGISTLVAPSNSPHGLVALLKTAGWAIHTRLPSVIFEFNDGTFGTFQGCFPGIHGLQAFKQDTAVADEYALEFQVPWACKVDGWWASILPAADTSDFDVVLYDGITALATTSVEAGHVAAAASQRVLQCSLSSEISLAANTTYRLAFKPTQTTSTITVYYIDISAAAHMQALDGGGAFTYTTRVDEGSWAAATPTRRLVAGIRISALDDGTGSGGGGGRPELRGTNL